MALGAGYQNLQDISSFGHPGKRDSALRVLAPCQRVLRPFKMHTRALISITASIAQLVEHALRKRTVVGSIPTGGFCSTPTLMQSMLFEPARLMARLPKTGLKTKKKPFCNSRWQCSYPSYQSAFFLTWRLSCAVLQNAETNNVAASVELRPVACILVTAPEKQKNSRARWTCPTHCH